MITSATPATPTAMLNLVQIGLWGLLGKWVKFYENCFYLFIYTFCENTLTR